MPGLTQKFTKTRKSTHTAEIQPSWAALHSRLLSQQIKKKEGKSMSLCFSDTSVKFLALILILIFFYFVRKCFGAQNAIPLFPLRGKGLCVCVYV